MDRSQLSAHLILSVVFGIISFELPAREYSLRGLLEANYSFNSSERFSQYTQPQSYLRGDYGKFGYDNGSVYSLSQAVMVFETDWENNLSARLITNGYLGGVKKGLGITEAFLKYKGIPNENGYLYSGRAGIIYPLISLENIATGWSSPYTLNYSMINSWIGEEVRHAGIELSLQRLGKFRKKNYDLGISVSLFRHNDTSGALLAWHGWNQQSRQTLWHEQIKLPNRAIRMEGQILSDQSDESKPFTEIDGRTGYHVNTSWRWKKKTDLLMGYYDNRTHPFIEIDGQYGWHTRFHHIGLRWKIFRHLTLIGQYLAGDTLMQSPNRNDIVNVEYKSNFLLLSRRWNNHRLSFRIEDFQVLDYDNTVGDDNSENGDSLTISYAFKMNRKTFLHSEYIRVQSSRPSREYHNQSVEMAETQIQFAIRYFF